MAARLLDPNAPLPEGDPAEASVQRDEAVLLNRATRLFRARADSQAAARSELLARQWDLAVAR